MHDALVRANHRQFGFAGYPNRNKLKLIVLAADFKGEMDIVVRYYLDVVYL